MIFEFKVIKWSGWSSRIEKPNSPLVVREAYQMLKGWLLRIHITMQNLLDPRANGNHHLETVFKRVETFLHQRKKEEGKYIFMEPTLCATPFMHILLSDPHINTGNSYYYCPTFYKKLGRCPGHHSDFPGSSLIWDMLILYFDLPIVMLFFLH